MASTLPAPDAQEHYDGADSDGTGTSSSQSGDASDDAAAPPSPPPYSPPAGDDVGGHQAATADVDEDHARDHAAATAELCEIVQRLAGDAARAQALAAGPLADGARALAALSAQHARDAAAIASLDARLAASTAENERLAARVASLEEAQALSDEVLRTKLETIDYLQQLAEASLESGAPRRHPAAAAGDAGTLAAGADAGGGGHAASGSASAPPKRKKKWGRRYPSWLRMKLKATEAMTVRQLRAHCRSLSTKLHDAECRIDELERDLAGRRRVAGGDAEEDDAASRTPAVSPIARLREAGEVEL